tara:strand:- start:405 stop:947 length:543 start_codon:yes stop_codon:yes gene_type:complete
MEDHFQGPTQNLIRIIKQHHIFIIITTDCECATAFTKVGVRTSLAHDRTPRTIHTRKPLTLTLSQTLSHENLSNIPIAAPFAARQERFPRSNSGTAAAVLLQLLITTTGVTTASASSTSIVTATATTAGASAFAQLPPRSVRPRVGEAATTVPQISRRCLEKKTFHRRLVRQPDLLWRGH